MSDDDHAPVGCQDEINAGVLSARISAHPSGTDFTMDASPTSLFDAPYVEFTQRSSSISLVTMLSPSRARELAEQLRAAAGRAEEATDD